MDQSPRDPSRLKAKVRAFALREGYRIETLPLVGFLMKESDASDMPLLYHAMDCFVLATRGEGWGLPLQEAMAMGIPTIGTNWGGNLEFMNTNNSLLIDVEGLITESDLRSGKQRHFPLDDAPSHDSSRVSGRRGKPVSLSSRVTPMFAVPSVKHLALHMQKIRNDPAFSRDVGQRARRHIQEKYSREAVRNVVQARLLEIAKNLK